MKPFVLVAILLLCGCEGKHPISAKVPAAEESPPVLASNDVGRFSVMQCQYTGVDGKTEPILVRVDTMTGRTWRYGSLTLDPTPSGKPSSVPMDVWLTMDETEEGALSRFRMDKDFAAQRGK